MNDSLIASQVRTLEMQVEILKQLISLGGGEESGRFQSFSDLKGSLRHTGSSSEEDIREAQFEFNGDDRYPECR